MFKTLRLGFNLLKLVVGLGFFLGLLRFSQCFTAVRNEGSATQMKSMEIHSTVLPLANFIGMRMFMTLRAETSPRGTPCPVHWLPLFYQELHPFQAMHLPLTKYLRGQKHASAPHEHLFDPPDVGLRSEAN